METTTLKLQRFTKQELDSFREYRNESYDEVIHKLVSIVQLVKRKPLLGQEAIRAIELARSRIKAGNFVTEEEARKRLGL